MHGFDGIATVKPFIDEEDVLDYCKALESSMHLVPRGTKRYLSSRNYQRERLEFWVASFDEAEHILSILIFPCKIRRVRMEPFSSYPHAHYEFRRDTYRLYGAMQPRSQYWLYTPR